MAYTLGEAAKAVGRSKAAIWQAVTSNRISASKDARNRWQIEPGELFKIWPPIQQSKREPQNDNQTLLEAKISFLRQQCELLEKRVLDLQKDRDAWVDHSRRIVGLLSADRALQLESFSNRAPTVIEVPPANSNPQNPEKKPRWRFFGRG